MKLPQRYNTIRCPLCRRRVLTIEPTTGEVLLAPGAAVVEGPAGPLGNWVAKCPRGHQFRVSDAIGARDR